MYQSKHCCVNTRLRKNGSPKFKFVVRLTSEDTFQNGAHVAAEPLIKDAVDEPVDKTVKVLHPCEHNQHIEIDGAGGKFLVNEEQMIQMRWEHAEKEG